MADELLKQAEPASRAALYQALAEMLTADGSPDWMAGPGITWPLYQAAQSLAPSSASARLAKQALAAIPSRTAAALRESHRDLFARSSPPYFSMYESAWISGRLLGPETLEVERLYRAVGLEPEGSELPDHASVELAFLAYLAGGGSQTEIAEREFIRQHAGRWLPSFGRGLARSGDRAYAAVGQPLIGWLGEARCHPVQRRRAGCGQPSIPFFDDCTLCGFCVQACPARALEIIESKTETALRLFPSLCMGCGRCERACEFKALRMEVPPIVSDGPSEKDAVILRLSLRAYCPSCGNATVSRAELDFVRDQLDNPTWLENCLDCRPIAFI
jgi:TorA maturation chaperone TorD/ferredoxin